MRPLALSLLSSSPLAGCRPAAARTADAGAAVPDRVRRRRPDRDVERRRCRRANERGGFSGIRRRRRGRVADAAQSEARIRTPGPPPRMRWAKSAAKPPRRRRHWCKALKDDDKEVRRQAAQALGRIVAGAKPQTGEQRPLAAPVPIEAPTPTFPPEKPPT